MAWKAAQRTLGPCISCHTGMTYLMARPVLRRTLHESLPTPYETGLLKALQAGVGYKEGNELQAGYTSEPKASQAIGVESIMAARFLAGTPDERRAFDRLWALQRDEDWHWFSLSLDPWEMPDSEFFGANWRRVPSARLLRTSCAPGGSREGEGARSVARRRAYQAASA